MMIPARISITAFLVASILIIVSFTATQRTAAEDSGTQLVPEPQVNERHEFNKHETYGDIIRERFDNEKWGIEIRYGDVATLIGATNYTEKPSDFTNVAYSQNINFEIDGKLYISMFTIDHIMLRIGTEETTVPLRNCDGFTLTRTPITYDGTIPTMTCNITFEDIRVYSDNHDSTFDLTLVHLFRGDWNETSIKVEALFDFSNTQLYNDSELAAGNAYTAEVIYIMQLTDPDLQGDNTVMPSGVTDETLEYNLTLDNGSPYTLSKLEMRDGFTIHNATGESSAVGYSRMMMANQSVAGLQSYNPKSAMVIHGFPDLIYKDTIWLKSDPEITVFHDRVTVGGAPGQMNLLMIVALVAAAVVVAAVLIIWKRKKTHDPAQKRP